ncbi:MAG: type II secretion system protein GspG [Planctomycetota bacterium]|nr:type II secretion system protein GspG [Planctomycetota bacterium]
MSDRPSTTEAPRELPKQRKGAPKPGAKRRQYLRYKRIATVLGLLVVAGVAVILAGVFAGPAEDEGVAATRALLDDLAAALDAHHARVGELPTRVSELVNPNSPYKGSAIPEDAWRRLIQYKAVDVRGGVWRLRSLGEDGKPGTPDDMVWPEGSSWD